MNREDRQIQPERLLIQSSHADVTADATRKLYVVPAGRKLVIKRVQYNNPTGLAAAAVDFYTVKLMNGATVVASRNTQTGSGGALLADTPVTLTLNATVANRTYAAGDVVSMFYDRAAGAATLPAGDVWIDALLY